MKINIYYGGRGILGDPSLYVVQKMQQVFEELNIKVERYDLFDQRINITTLPQSLKEVDGIILATTVEWHGIGGSLTSFLDACWLYGDKKKIANIYMAPVVMATTYGEKEAELDLTTAWEALGGLTCHGISGYVPEINELEHSEAYQKVIEKSAEYIFRSIDRKIIGLPVSSKVVSQNIYRTKDSFLTQKETEQLSEYISDDTYVKKQKEDILELTSQFKGKMSGMLENKGAAGKGAALSAAQDAVQGTMQGTMQGTVRGSAKNSVGDSGLDEFISAFRQMFDPIPEVHFKCMLTLTDYNQNIILRIDNSHLESSIGELAYPDLVLTMDSKMLRMIISGEKSFNMAFLSGSMKTRGELHWVKTMDEIFLFGN